MNIIKTMPHNVSQLIKCDNFIPESSIKNIQKQDKIFLLVIGGSASGKNYVYNKIFHFPLIDIDIITNKLSNGNIEKARTLVSNAIVLANDELDNYFKSGRSVAQVTTGAGTKGVNNKIKMAKNYGFKTALVLVDTDLKIAHERNVKRSLQGKQRFIPYWKVEKTNKEAKETFKQLKSIVDYSLIIKN